jgi:hypothetical protein
MKRIALVALIALAGCGESKPAAAPKPVAEAPCRPPQVLYTPYPGGDERMARIPWLRGSPRELGLVGLLWYWPEKWRHLRRARVFTGGVAPQGYSAKVLWAFLAPAAFDRAGGELLIEGRNLDGPGTFRETFAAISYEGQEGAPSYASILDLGRPGCWRLTLTTGDLRAVVDIQAVR